MFELGFGKLLLIGIVALIVLGPERLPKAARLTGLWVRRVRAYWFNMRAELERELAAEDMRKQLEDAKQSLQNVAIGMDEAKSTEGETPVSTQPGHAPTPSDPRDDHPQ